MLNTVEGYVKAFKAGERVPVEGLCGRLIRGKCPEDFKTLTDDSSRLIVMLMGPDGLEQLIGLNGYEIMQEICYPDEYIRAKVLEGNSFKLVVCGESDHIRPADWEGAIAIASQVYPDIASVLRAHSAGLRNTPFAEIETAAGFNFHDVNIAGPADPRYMTYERFRALPRNSVNLVAIRAFLYYTLHLRELYAGNGRVADGSGNEGMLEYFALNVPLDALGQHALIDITLPPDILERCQ